MPLGQGTITGTFSTCPTACCSTGLGCISGLRFKKEGQGYSTAWQGSNVVITPVSAWVPSGEGWAYNPNSIATTLGFVEDDEAIELPTFGPSIAGYNYGSNPVDPANTWKWKDILTEVRLTGLDVGEEYRLVVDTVELSMSHGTYIVKQTVLYFTPTATEDGILLQVRVPANRFGLYYTCTIQKSYPEGGTMVRKYLDITPTAVSADIPCQISGQTLKLSFNTWPNHYFDDQGYIHFGASFKTDFNQSWSINPNYPYQMWGKESDGSIPEESYVGHAWTTFEIAVNDVQPITWRDYFKPGGPAVVTDISGMIGGIMDNLWIGFIRGKVAVWGGNNEDFVYWGPNSQTVIQTNADAVPGRYRLAIRTWLYQYSSRRYIERIILSRDGTVLADYTVPDGLLSALAIGPKHNLVNIEPYYIGWNGYYPNSITGNYAYHASHFMAKYKLGGIRVWRGNYQL